MKRKEDDDNLLSQTAYWNMKLGIKHATEKARYKKLCGYSLPKYDKEELDGAYYITFSDWKEYMEEKLSVLSQEELLEYSKYLNLRLEKGTAFEGLFQNYIFPFMVAILSPLISEMILKCVTNEENVSVNDFGTFIIKLIICMSAFYIMMKYVMNNVMANIEDDKASYLFYKDMHDLVTTKLK